MQFVIQAEASGIVANLLQVHRGVYEAAELLYERFKPLVEEHLASSPFAKIAFAVSTVCSAASWPMLAMPDAKLWHAVHKLVHKSTAE